MLLPADPSGDRWADLVPRMYEELRTLAHAHLRREQTGHTLGTTALVHEAWLRLVPQSARSSGDAVEFFRVASTTMRRVLVDHARARRSAKRGGNDPTEQTSLDEADSFLSERESEELLALDDALKRLAVANPRACEVVLHRFFGGFSEQETAQLLGMSAKTVQRDWLAARAWLRKEVEGDLGLSPTREGERSE